MKPADLSLQELPKSISRKTCCIKKHHPDWSFRSSDSTSKVFLIVLENLVAEFEAGPTNILI